MKQVAGWVIIVLALAGVLAIVLMPVTQAWGERVEANTQIKQDWWTVERVERARRAQGRTDAIIAASNVALWTLAIGIPAVALIALVLWFRVATQRRVVQKLPADVPVLIERRIYDPRSTVNLSLDAAHAPSIDHGQALALGRTQYTQVELKPRFPVAPAQPVLEVDYE